MDTIFCTYCTLPILETEEAISCKDMHTNENIVVHKECLEEEIIRSILG